jgi:hypothetical protein
MLLRRFLPRKSAARIDLGSVVVPDSGLAKEAAELCIASSSESLANHCFRTFYWGSLLARADGLQFDPELFWVASLLHDQTRPEILFAAADGPRAGPESCPRQSVVTST